MPSSRTLLDEVGLVPRWEFPTHDAFKVLQHLNLPGEPRLYVQTVENGVLRCNLSNSEGIAGFPTRIDVRNLIDKKFVELDTVAINVCPQSMRVYQLSAQGREILVQSAAHDAYQKLIRTEMPKIIERLREEFSKTTEA